QVSDAEAQLLQYVNAYGVRFIVIPQDVQQEGYNTRIVMPFDVHEQIEPGRCRCLRWISLHQALKVVHYLAQSRLGPLPCCTSRGRRTWTRVPTPLALSTSSAPPAA